ncbi:hypothetical protein [Paucibacter sp. DJ2R-2]|uniref:hypothetical protein n=1 Tax=unclassified Roseateles TaxID=2626991 RepID=UPI0021E4337E|nr:hypothetical protein [Paucibacter sp. DJ2R-2]MCV2438691.1 hypothetical protein [Paucibacter sp. DJ2R-2]
MPDISTIKAALSSIETAADIAKVLQDSNSSLEKFEHKSQLANLVEALANAQMDLVNLQGKLSEKGNRVAQLALVLESDLSYFF